MLISCYLIKNLSENKESYKEPYKRKYKSNYNISDYDLLYSAAILFLIFECILFYYAIKLSNFCSTNTHHLIINYIFSITFTTPYVFFNTLSNPCAKQFFESLEPKKIDLTNIKPL